MDNDATPNKKPVSKDREFHANSAYSGSGAMQPGGDTGEPGKQDDLDGNLQQVKKQSGQANNKSEADT